MNTIWQRIENWIANNSPTGTHSLAGGALAEELAKAESVVGKLPSEVRSSYKLHDGSNLIWLADDGYLMPLFVPTHLSRRKQSRFNAVVKRWKLLKELLDEGQFDGPGFRSDPTGPIKTDHWNPNWIPITDNKCGDHLCVDLSPAEGGKKGQIIRWDHEIGAVRVVSFSMFAWLSQVADDLENGRYVFDAKSGALKPNQRRKRGH